MNSEDYNHEFSPDSMEERRKKRVQNFHLKIDDNKISDEENKNSKNIYNSIKEQPAKRTGLELNSYSNENAKVRIAQNSAKVLKQQTKEEKKLAKKRGKKNKRIFRMIWMISVIMMSIFLSQFFMVGVNDLLAIDRTDNSTIRIVVPENAELSDISRILLENKVINNTSYFELYVKATKAEDSFRQGKFDLRRNMDYESIVNYLQSNINRKDTKTVQFTEGINVLEISKKLVASNVLSTPEKFLELCKSDTFDEDYEFLKEIKNTKDRYYKLEGYLFPDTYTFYVNEDPENIIARFLDNCERRLYYTKAKAEGFSKKVTIIDRVKPTAYSMDEILNMASIIQAEALNVKDMFNISSILRNRLNYGELADIHGLDCDSTVFYPYKSRIEIPTDMRANYESRYSTYKLKGLPPGPICSPGLDAINAAIDPNDTDYLYFCHSSATSGAEAKAWYAVTHDDHEANLVKAGLQ